MEITACPVCGSKKIGIGTLGDGIISGLSSWNEVCKDCGYQGASLVFESEAQYNKFLEGLAFQKKQRETQAQGSNEEKPVQSSEDRAGYPKKKSYLFEFVLSVVLTIVFFIILSGSNFFGKYPDLLSQNNLSILIVFILSSFLGIILLFFFIIVLGEILYRSILGKKK